MIVFDVGILGPLTHKNSDLYQAPVMNLLPMVGAVGLCFYGELGPVTMMVKLILLYIQVRVTPSVWELTVSSQNASPYGKVVSSY